MSRAIVDSANALEEMAKETPAFTKEHRNTMAAAVSTYMHGNDVASVGSAWHKDAEPSKPCRIFDRIVVERAL